MDFFLCIMIVDFRSGDGRKEEGCSGSGKAA